MPTHNISGSSIHKWLVPGDRKKLEQMKKQKQPLGVTV